VKRHEVFAMSTTDGTLRWRRNTGEAGGVTAGSLALVAGDCVVVGDYHLIALRLSDGAPCWRFEPAEGYGPGLYLGSVASGAVFAGSPAGRMYAVDAASGRALWTATVGTDGATTVFPPIIRNGLVVAGFNSFAAPNRGGVVALDAASGVVRWRRDFAADANPSSAAFAGGPVFVNDLVVAASGAGSIHAFDRATGQEAWTIEAHAAVRARRDYRPLLAVGNVIVAASLDGIVTAYDAGTRRAIWTYGDGSDGSTAPALSADGQFVYVPYLSGRLVALDGATGALRWRVGDAFDRLSWPAASARDRVLASGSRGFTALHR
jgi:outer membrane protein assembly factor BamB